MKTITQTLILPIVLMLIFTVPTVHAQNIVADTTMANKHFETAKEYFENKSYDTAILYFEKASILYENHQQWRKYLHSETKHGECYQKQWHLDLAIATIKPAIDKTLLYIDENDTIVADAYHILGKQYYYQSKLDSTLFYWKKTFELRLGLFGEIHPDVAISFSNIGAVYYSKCEYDLALKQFFKALQIQKGLLDESHTSIASFIFNIAAVYDEKSEYDLALQYYFEALQMFKELQGDINTNVASCYNNIGLNYSTKGEYNLALEYLLKSLQIFKEILGENHKSVASNYSNIGINYSNKNDYDLALQYYFKALQIFKELFGEKHTDVASTYFLIGNANKNLEEYGLALEYYFKALEIYKELRGETHTDVAKSYIHIGKVYCKEKEYDLTLKYYFKALKIRKELFGEKHNYVAWAYHAIGNCYSFKNEYHQALQYYQKGLAACLRNFNDTANIYTVPVIEDYLNWNVVLEILQAKAEIFADSNINLPGFGNLEGLEEALRHYQACDTLISKVRRDINTKSDKIALGEKASKVYERGINVCLDLASGGGAETRHALSLHHHQQALSQQMKYTDLAFYFSEKNKASVLLESLAAADARKFAGIPDLLLALEHKLSIDIVSYKQILAAGQDSLTRVNFQDKLFKENRSHDSLLLVFENSYPKYFELKYNQNPATVAEIQKQLDSETAMISYFTGDSSITIFTLTSNNLEISTTPVEVNFDTLISDFCYYGLAYGTNPYRFAKTYKQTAYDLCLKLIPNNLDKNIKNLIIIPDAALGTIPFETLLTAKPGNKEWKDLPYLIKKYNVSYAYSANLFLHTFPQHPAKDDESAPLNDWLALAPVFDNTNIAGTTIETQAMMDEIYAFVDDTISTRGRLINEDYIRELPGTETEVNLIFDAFDKKNLSATLKTRSQANEEFVKSGELKNYRYLHFATHGFVNIQKPELSGIFLAQDTLSAEDGILYTGEMYNLDLNSDLIVLSACETALGKITRGEGIIGLGRALMYAGTKNLMVSLWEVPDLSTSTLMTSFYNNMLDDGQQSNVLTYLRQAKLKMIDEGTYAHPYYWSPFILIGK